MEDIETVFEKYMEDEFLKFDRVQEKLSQRPDLHAFLLLDSLVPGKGRIVSAAEHDEIYLGVDLAELAESSITEDQVRDLVRCGVREDEESLCMFV